MNFINFIFLFGLLGIFAAWPLLSFQVIVAAYATKTPFEKRGNKMN